MMIRQGAMLETVTMIAIENFIMFDLCVMIMIVALGMCRSEVSVRRSGGAVINPHVFCIVRSLLMSSLITPCHKFQIFIFSLFMAPCGTCW